MPNRALASINIKRHAHKNSAWHITICSINNINKQQLVYNKKSRAPLKVNCYATQQSDDLSREK